MMVHFYVDGQVRGKQRPRFSRSGHVYTPKETHDYERKIRSAYMEQCGGTWFVDTAIAMVMKIYVAVPKSASRKRKMAMLNGDEKPMGKPDIDNVAKVVMDALNGVAYADDKMISRIVAERSYSESPGVDVVISELISQPDTDEPLDAGC